MRPWWPEFMPFTSPSRSQGLTQVSPKPCGGDVRRPTGTSHKEAHRATFCIRAYDHQERLLPGIPLPSGERIIGSSIGLEKREQVRDPYADLVARTKSLPPGMKASKPEQEDRKSTRLNSSH